MKKPRLLRFEYYLLADGEIISYTNFVLGLKRYKKSIEANQLSYKRMREIHPNAVILSLNGITTVEGHESFYD